MVDEEEEPLDVEEEDIMHKEGVEEAPTLEGEGQ